MKGYLRPAPIIILALILTGCVTVFVPVDTPTPPPTAIILPTLPPPTTTPTLVVLTPTKVKPAPVCSVNPLAAFCAVPETATLSKSCVSKVPYTLLAFTAGSTFEVTADGMTCKDEGLRNGQQQVSCTGDQLYSYYIKVCNPNCGDQPLDTNSQRCSNGYGYSADGGCCWPTSALGEGCVLYKVDIGACP